MARKRDVVAYRNILPTLRPRNPGSLRVRTTAIDRLCSHRRPQFCQRRRRLRPRWSQVFTIGPVTTATASEMKVTASPEFDGRLAAAILRARLAQRMASSGS